MTEKALDMTLALLSSGKVLCLYRNPPRGSVSAEFYQPESNTWIPARDAPSASPARFTLHPLHSGQVLFGTEASEWRMHAFDPFKTNWNLVGHLPGALPWGVTATPLSSGQTLFVGGQLRTEQPLSTLPQRTVWLHGPRSP